MPPAYSINWKKSAVKELQFLPRPMALRVASAVEALAEIPFPSGCCKLQGSENAYRIRVGDYRVIYEVWGVQVVIDIIRVRHRRDVYRP